MELSSILSFNKTEEQEHCQMLKRLHWTNTILSWTEDVNCRSNIDEVAKRLKLNHAVATCFEDIVAIPCFLLIIDKDKWADFPTSLLQLYSESISILDSKEFAVVLTSQTDSKIGLGIDRFVLKTPKLIDRVWLEPTALQRKNLAQRTNKAAKRKETIIARRMLILLKGMHGEVIQSEWACKEFNISLRTFQRDIQFLNGIGELVEYDKAKSGYRLTYSHYKDMYDLTK